MWNLGEDGRLKSYCTSSEEFQKQQTTNHYFNKDFVDENINAPVIRISHIKQLFKYLTMEQKKAWRIVSPEENIEHERRRQIQYRNDVGEFIRCYTEAKMGNKKSDAYGCMDPLVSFYCKNKSSCIFIRSESEEKKLLEQFGQLLCAFGLLGALLGPTLEPQGCQVVKEV